MRMNVVFNDNLDTEVRMVGHGQAGQDHEYAVQRPPKEVDDYSVLQRRQTVYGSDKPDAEQHERDARNTLAPKMTRTVLGSSQPKDTVERRLETHDSTTQKPAVTPIDATRTNQAEPVAWRFSRPRPLSQTRCRMPFIRW